MAIGDSYSEIEGWHRPCSRFCRATDSPGPPGTERHLVSTAPELAMRPILTSLLLTTLVAGLAACEGVSSTDPSDPSGLVLERQALTAGTTNLDRHLIGRTTDAT